MKRIYFYLLFATVGLFTGINATHGQVIKNVAESTVNFIKPLDLVGTWDYEGVHVKFQSDNLLKKAGGKAAALQMEKELNKDLEGMGFKPGITTFIFNENGKFTNVTNGKKIGGKYSYDKESKYITLRYARILPIKAKVSGSGKKISLLFEAGGFLSMVTFIGSHSGVSVIKGVSSLLNSYDGMMVGMELKRE